MHLPPPPQSPLEVLTPVIDLGQMRQGETRTVDFQLCNRTKGTIRISRIWGHCSCTSHKLTRPELASGESATLTLTYKSGNSRGVTGSLVNVYYYLVGQEKLLHAECRIKANVQPNVTWSPADITFHIGQSKSCHVVLQASAAEQVVLADAACTRNGLAVTIDESKDPKTAHLTILFEAERWGTKPGKAELIVRLHDAAVPVLRIPINIILPEQKGNSS